MTQAQFDFEQAWVGKVPARWRWTRNKELLVESQAVTVDGSEELLSVSHLTGITPKSEKNVTMTAAENLDGYRLVGTGDLVINTMWAWMGALGVARQSGIVSPAYGVYSPRPDAPFNPAFYDYLYRSTPYVMEMTRLSRGIWSSRLRLYPDVFLRMGIPVPPPEEQRTIADYLDRETARIDTLIEEQQHLIEMLRERRTAAIAACLESLGGMTRLKHVSTVQTGVTLSGEGDPADPEWPYLRVANVQVGYVDLREIKTVRVPPDRAAGSMLQPGDVLMTEGGDIDKLGRGAPWRGEVPNMLHQNHVFAVRPSEALDSEFLVYWLDGPVGRTYFRTTAKQTTNLAGTNKWTLGNLPVPVPPLDEQRRVVEALDEQTTKIDTLITESERLIDLSCERRAALITAAVTGQIDVREMV